ncbi:hypothetical protein [Aestuariibaculum sediminum]|uniref:Uncharacterized protein n=1 Tax=Aestuariibaculum sediminum TaxID=2770637 RepID=A0A8J6QL69_9FLAO|nr:hypothetical protein [Aestuariibaculum sediminum]MBD0833289.1 hypothetical protein [Aestuariibaculum sediminum]
MRKIIVANINSALSEELNKGKHHLEFELEKTSELLSNGWHIIDYYIVNTSDSLFSFSIVYILEKT